MARRHLKRILCSLALLLVTLGAGPAAAQHSENSTSDEGIAQGLELQARLKAGGILDRAMPSPGFAVGFHTNKLSILGGFNWYRFKYSETFDDGTEFETTGSLFQILPMFQYDVFTSADKRSRLGILGGVGFGRFNLGSNGSDATATFIPVRAGLGGDYFLSKHFALGLETGVQMAFLTGVDSPGANDLDIGFGANMFYGAIRARFVL